MKGAQARPVAIGQGQVDNADHPRPVGVGGARLAQAQACALGLAIYTVVFFPQFDRQAPGAVAAFVVVEHGEYLRFSGRTAPAAEACR